MTCLPIVLVIWFAEVWLGKPPIMTITLFLGRDHAKASDNPRSAGKNSREAANHGHPALFDHDIAKNSDTTTTNWGKFLGKPPFMAIPLYWTPLAPKLPTGWEKLQPEPPIMAISKNSDDRIGQTRRGAPCRRRERQGTFFVDQSSGSKG